MQKLPKKQVGTAGQGGMSYKYMSCNDGHYLVFLDNEKNMSLPDNKRPYMHNDGAGAFLTTYLIEDKKEVLRK